MTRGHNSQRPDQTLRREGKVLRVLPSGRWLHPNQGLRQFLRDQASDSDEVVTPLMLDGTYLSRNFATLGPIFWQPPWEMERTTLAASFFPPRAWELVSTVGSLLSSLSFTPTKRYEEVDGVRKEKERLTTDQPTLPRKGWLGVGNRFIASLSTLQELLSLFCWKSFLSRDNKTQIEL